MVQTWALKGHHVMTVLCITCFVFVVRCFIAVDADTFICLPMFQEGMMHSRFTIMIIVDAVVIGRMMAMFIVNILCDKLVVINHIHLRWYYNYDMLSVLVLP